MRHRVSKEEKQALELRKLRLQKIASVACSLYDDEFEDDLNSIMYSMSFVEQGGEYYHEDCILVKTLANVHGPTTDNRLRVVEEEIENFYRNQSKEIDAETLDLLEEDANNAIEAFNSEMKFLKKKCETEPFSLYMAKYKMMMASKAPLSKEDLNSAIRFSSRLSELQRIGEKYHLIMMDDDGSPKDCPFPEW